MPENPRTSKEESKISLEALPTVVLSQIAHELSINKATRLTTSHPNFLEDSEDIIDFQNRLKAEYIKPGNHSANKATFLRYPEHRKPKNLFDDRIGRAYIVKQVTLGNFRVLPEPERTNIKNLAAETIRDRYGFKTIKYRAGVLGFIASKQLSLKQLTTLSLTQKNVLCEETYRQKIAAGKITVEQALSIPYQPQPSLAKKLFLSDYKQGRNKTIKYSGIATGILPGLAVGILNFLFNISTLAPKDVWHQDNWVLTDTFYTLYKAPGIIIGAILGVFTGLTHATVNLMTRQSLDTNAKDIYKGLEKLHTLPAEDFDQVINEIIKCYKQNKHGTLKQSNRSNKLLKELESNPTDTTVTTSKDHQLEKIQTYMLGSEGNQGKQLYCTIAQILKNQAKPQQEEQVTIAQPR